jgi:hypothetical protein
MLHMLPRPTIPVVVQPASEAVDSSLSPTGVAPLPLQAEEEYDEETRYKPHFFMVGTAKTRVQKTQSAETQGRRDRTRACLCKRVCVSVGYVC